MGDSELTDAKHCRDLYQRFGQEQLDLVLGLGISHLIFVMDGDAGGKAGVAAFLKLVGV